MKLNMKIKERPSEIHVRVEDEVGKKAVMTRRDGGHRLEVLAVGWGEGDPPSRLPTTRSADSGQSRRVFQRK